MVAVVTPPCLCFLSAQTRDFWPLRPLSLLVNFLLFLLSFLTFWLDPILFSSFFNPICFVFLFFWIWFFFIFFPLYFLFSNSLPLSSLSSPHPIFSDLFLDIFLFLHLISFLFLWLFLSFTIHSFFLLYFLLFPPIFLSNPSLLYHPLPSHLGCQSSLCTPYDITQGRLQPVHATLRALVAKDMTSPYRKQNKSVSPPSPTSCRATQTPSLVSVTTQTPPPAWQIWDIVGSSLVHILCLVLLFVAYSWSELT